MNPNDQHEVATARPEDETAEKIAKWFKTRQCKSYRKTGECRKQHRCTFAHGEEEMRTAEQNFADGLITPNAVKAWMRARDSNEPPMSATGSETHEEPNVHRCVIAPAKGDAHTTEQNFAAGLVTSTAFNTQQRARQKEAVAAEKTAAQSAEVPQDGQDGHTAPNATPTKSRLRASLVDALAQLERLAAANTAVVRRADARVAVPASAQAHVQRYGAQDLEPLTQFHSLLPPSSPLQSIFDMVAEHMPTFDDATGLTAAAIMLRFSDTTGLPLTSHMLHRLFLAALLAAAKAHPFDPDAPVRAVARVSDVHEREVRYLVGVLLNALKWRVPATRDETVAAIGNAVWQGLATARSDTMSVLTSTLPVSDGDRRLVVADPAWLRAKPPPAATTTVLRSPLRASTHTPLPSLSSPLQPPPPAPDPARGVYGYFRHEAGSLDTADTVDVNLIAIDQPVHQRVVSENLLRQIDPNTVQVLNDVDQ